MTEKELSQIHYINIEIKHIQDELNKLECRSMVKGQEITGMPGVTGTSDKVGDYATEKAELEMFLDMAVKKLYVERNRIERFLAMIQNADDRLLVRLRSVNCMSWYKIGDELGIDRRTAQKRYKEILKMY